MEYYLSLRLLHCEEHYFVENSHFQVNEKSSVALVTESSMLEASGYSTLFSIKN
jgi:hypothetical protein